MRLEDYKNAMASVTLDENAKSCARRRVQSFGAVGGTRRAAILRLPAAAAAILAVLLAGAVTAAAVGTGFFGLKKFFDEAVKRSGSGLSTEAAEGFGGAGEISASSGKVSANIVETVCDGHYIVAIVEVDASECDIPGEAVPVFRRFGDNFHGGTVGMTLLGRSGGIFTYGYYDMGFAEIPDGGEIFLGGFGYSPDGGYSDFVPLCGGELDFGIDKNMLNVLDFHDSKQSPEICGITVSTSLSPLGILFRLSDRPTGVFGIEEGIEFMDILNISVNFSDGSVQGFDTGLFRSQNGWIDQKTGEYCEYIGFVAPVDVSEIESIEFHGEKFFFDKEVKND